jgi:hypothetical protein
VKFLRVCTIGKLESSNFYSNGERADKKKAFEFLLGIQRLDAATSQDAERSMN